MAANGRGNMRPAGRSPPFLAIGLFVALVILGFNYWSLSSRNGEQANEIVLLESELRLVNAKKTSAEKRSEAISDKVTELESQINNQKEVIAKGEADRANLEREKQATIERNNELENEVRGVRDQQLPACENDKKNLQQEADQLRADIEVIKNKECGISDCETFIKKERDGLIEDMYKVVGALPLISMYKANIKLGSYQSQISSLASQMDEDALKKQEQQQQQQQQQQQVLDNHQQQRLPSDTQQQQALNQQQQQENQNVQKNPAADVQQQAPVDNLQQQQQQGIDDAMQQQQQQQAPVDNLQQQQQAPIDNMHQQQDAMVDTNQQQAAVDNQQQQQAPVDGQQQQQQGAFDQQQQQPYFRQVVDTNAQTADQNQQGVGPAPVMNQDPSVDETKKDASNANDADTVKAMDADRLQNADQGAAKPTTAAPEGTNTTTKTTKTTAGTTPKLAGDGNAQTADAMVPNDDKGDRDYDDEDDDDADPDRDAADDTLRVNKDDQEYDYDDGDDDDDDDYDYDKKTDDVKKDENGIDTMFQNDQRAAQNP